MITRSMILPGLAAAMIGLGAGRAFRHSDETPMPGSDPRLASSEKTTSAAVPLSPQNRHTLEALLRDLSHRGMLSPQAAKGIESMQTAELWKLLQDEDTWKGDEGSTAIRLDALKFIAHELYRREGLQAVTLAAEAGNKDVAGLVLTDGLSIDPASAAPLLHHYAKEWGGTWALRVVEASYALACGSDAKATLELERLFFNDYLISPPGTVTRFAPNFDFETYITQSTAMFTVTSAATVWAIQNPEAASKAFDGKFAGKPWLLGAIMTGMLRSTGTDAASRWMADRLENLPQPNRTQAIASLNGSYPFTTPEHVEMIMNALRRDEDRMEYALRTARGNVVRGRDAFLQAVTMAGSAEQQWQILTSTAKAITQYSGYPEGKNPGIPAMVDALERLGATEQQRADIMEILTAPKS